MACIHQLHFACDHQELAYRLKDPPCRIYMTDMSFRNIHEDVSWGIDRMVWQFENVFLRHLIFVSRIVLLLSYEALPWCCLIGIHHITLYNTMALYAIALQGIRWKQNQGLNTQVNTIVVIISIQMFIKFYCVRWSANQPGVYAAEQLLGSCRLMRS